MSQQPDELDILAGQGQSIDYSIPLKCEKSEPTFEEMGKYALNPQTLTDKEKQTSLQNGVTRLFFEAEQELVNRLVAEKVPKAELAQIKAQKSSLTRASTGLGYVEVFLTDEDTPEVIKAHPELVVDWFAAAGILDDKTLTEAGLEYLPEEIRNASNTGMNGEDEQADTTVVDKTLWVLSMAALEKATEVKDGIFANLEKTLLEATGPDPTAKEFVTMAMGVKRGIVNEIELMVGIDSFRGLVVKQEEISNKLKNGGLETLFEVVRCAAFYMEGRAIAEAIDKDKRPYLGPTAKSLFIEKDFATRLYEDNEYTSLTKEGAARMAEKFKRQVEGLKEAADIGDFYDAPGKFALATGIIILAAETGGFAASAAVEAGLVAEGGIGAFFIDATAFGLMNTAATGFAYNRYPESFKEFGEEMLHTYATFGALRVTGRLFALFKGEERLGWEIINSKKLTGAELSEKEIGAVTKAIGGNVSVPKALLTDGAQLLSLQLTLIGTSALLALLGIGEMPEGIGTFKDFLTLAILHYRGGLEAGKGKEVEEKELAAGREQKFVNEGLSAKFKGANGNENGNGNGNRNRNRNRNGNGGDIDPTGGGENVLYSFPANVGIHTVNAIIRGVKWLFGVRTNRATDVPEGKDPATGLPRSLVDSWMEVFKEAGFVDRLGREILLKACHAIETGSVNDMTASFKDLGLSEDVAKGLAEFVFEHKEEVKSLYREMPTVISTDSRFLLVKGVTELAKMPEGEALEFLKAVKGKFLDQLDNYLENYKLVKRSLTELQMNVSEEELSILVTDHTAQNVNITTKNLLGAVDKKAAVSAMVHRVRFLKEWFGITRANPLQLAHNVPLARFEVAENIHMDLEYGDYEAACGLQFSLYMTGANGRQIRLGTIGYQITEGSIQIVRYQGGRIPEEEMARVTGEFKTFSGGIDPMSWLAYSVGKTLLGMAENSGKELRWIKGESVAFSVPHFEGSPPKGIHSMEDVRRFWNEGHPEIEKLAEEYDRLQERVPKLKEAIAQRKEEIKGVDFGPYEYDERLLELKRELKSTEVGIDRLKPLVEMYRRGQHTAKLYNITAENLGLRPAKGKNNPWYRWTKEPEAFGRNIESRAKDVEAFQRSVTAFNASLEKPQVTATKNGKWSLSMHPASWPDGQNPFVIEGPDSTSEAQ